MILLLAAFLRLIQIATLPPGLNFDEAGSGAAALEILSGSPKLWWQLGGGQEPFWPYLAALSTAILGNMPLALRLPAVLIGILSVAAVYPLMLAFRLGPQRRDDYLIAGLTTLGLAVSGWHLHFSRLGFRAILLPLCSTLAFYFLWRGLKGAVHLTNPTDSGFRLRSRRPGPLGWVALASFFIALAIYSYLAARLLPLVPLLFLGLQWLIIRLKHLLNRQTQAPTAISKKTLFLISYFLFFLFLFLAPLMLYFIFNPTDFVARSASVSIFNPTWNNGDPIGTAWRTLITTLSTFTGFSGDPNPLVNLPGEPALPPLLAFFFCLGLLVSLYNAFSSTFQRSNLSTLFLSPYLFLLCWWTIMLLPAILAPEGAPHHLRLIGTIVPTYALVAIGFTVLTRLLTKLLFSLSFASVRSLPLGRLTPHLSCLLPLTCYLLVAWQSYSNYFVRWPVSVDFTLPFDLYAVRLVADIDHAPTQVGYVLPMDVRAGLEARHYTLDYLLNERQPRPYTYIPVDDHTAASLLTQAASGKNELRVVRWTGDKHREADAKEIVTYLLETSTRLQGRASFPVYDIETYTLLSPQTVFALPAITQPMGAVFTLPDTGQGLLRLEAAFVPASVSAGAWLPLAITLTPLGSMAADYKASLRLIGSTNERVAQKDRVLLHNFHQGTSLWPAEPVNEYYLLSVPSETPPGDYTVVIVIYHPDSQAPLLADGLAEVPLGQVSIK